MTRDEFIEQVNETYELVRFCYDNSLDDLVDYIYAEDTFNELIDEDISDWRDGWQDLYKFLDELPTSSETDYYYRDCYGDWYEFTYSDEENLKDDILARCDEEGIFDDAEEDDEEQEENYGEQEGGTGYWCVRTPEPEKEDEVPPPEEEFTIEEMLMIG